MFKAYQISVDGFIFKVVAVNTFFAKRKVYKRYKRTRDTNYKKFNYRISTIKVLFK